MNERDMITRAGFIYGLIITVLLFVYAAMNAVATIVGIID